MKLSKLMARSTAVLILGLAVMLGLPRAVSAAVVTLMPSSTLASIGDSLQFDLSITGVTDLYAFNFSLAFDPMVINGVSLSEGPALGTAGTTFFIPGDFDNSNGLLSLTGGLLIGAVPGFTGNGIFASIVFSAIGAGISGVTLNDVILLNSSLGLIPATVNSAVVQVGVGGTVPEPGSLLLVASALALAVWGVRQRDRKWAVRTNT